MEIRPIDANAVTDFLDMYFNELRGYCVCNETIAMGIKKTLQENVNLTPTLDYAPVVHAKWEYIGRVYGKENMQCGVCGNCGKITAIFSDEIKPEHAPCCCWCGAKMDLQEG